MRLFGRFLIRYRHRERARAALRLATARYTIRERADIVSFLTLQALATLRPHYCTHGELIRDGDADTPHRRRDTHLLRKVSVSICQPNPFCLSIL
jgi:hypothetical protein